MPGPTPHSLPAFKREAVELYRSSGKKSSTKMAEELGISSEPSGGGSNVSDLRSDVRPPVCGARGPPG